MFTKTGVWVDPQGTSHTDAVFVVAEASLNNTDALSYHYDNSAGFTGTTGTANTVSSQYLSYRMYYWTNAAARAAGNLPYVLASTNPVGEIHNDSNLGTGYATLTALQAAEKHCQAKVLI